MQRVSDLKDEVLSIVDQLSHDELRVFRFMGRRMIDIGHVKYGPLNLAKHDRIWSREMAQESADRLFYAQCQEIAKEDKRAENVNKFRLADAVSESMLSEFASAFPAQSPVHIANAEDKACTECMGINGKHGVGCAWQVLR